MSPDVSTCCIADFTEIKGKYFCLNCGEECSIVSDDPNNATVFKEKTGQDWQTARRLTKRIP